MDTANQTCGGFWTRWPPRRPTPGGGGASALVGALGTALCTMVGNYTVGKKKYAGVEEDVKGPHGKGGGHPGQAAGPGGRGRRCL